MGLVAHPIHGANKSDNNPESGNYKISIYTVQTHVNWSNQLLFVQLNHSRCVIFRLIQQKDRLHCPPGTVSSGISLWGGGLLQHSDPSHLQLAIELDGLPVSK